MRKAAIAILSRKNLLANLNVIKSHAPKSKIIAMVKANAYGHGLRSISIRIKEHVSSLGVARIDEALALREAQVNIPILLMEGVFEPHDLEICSQNNFQVVFHEQNQIDWLLNSNLAKKIDAWIKIDTGMGRLGFYPSAAINIIKTLNNSSKVNNPIGILSHLGCADIFGHPLNKSQIECFNMLASEHNGPKSLCNSAGIFHFKENHYDYIRPGLALYGASPIANKNTHELMLKPVMTLKTKLVDIKHMPKNSAIGYGARYICKENMRIGIAAIGYGDGYPRTARDGTPVLVNNISCPLVGRVSMDMITIDLSNNRHAKIDDSVILWGDGLPINEVAAHTGNCPYDLFTAVQNRVKFLWQDD